MPVGCCCIPIHPEKQSILPQLKSGLQAYLLLGSIEVLLLDDKEVDFGEFFCPDPPCACVLLAALEEFSLLSVRPAAQEEILASWPILSFEI